MIKFCFWGILTEISEQRIESFLCMPELCNLVKGKLFQKYIIHLLLTNNAYAFQQTITLYTALSDYHSLVLIALKTTVP